MGIHDGDVLVIESTQTAEIGDIVVALDDEGQNTLKKYNGYNNVTKKFELLYCNQSRYPDRVIEIDKLTIQYDIYSNNGQWFVRIKQTGEICQIDKPLLRYLRSEEKKITRSKEPITDMESYDYLLAVKSAIAHPLSTDCLLEDEDGNEIENAYFASSENIEDSFILKELMDEIFNSLTEVQKKFSFLSFILEKVYRSIQNERVYPSKISLKP